MKLTKKRALRMMREGGGNLDLYRSEITELPKGLVVDGYIDLYNTPIANLPEDLIVGETLYLNNTLITSLPAGIKVGGSLDLSNTLISSLPNNFTVGGSLYLSNTRITSLPDDIVIGGSLDLSNTLISSLPDNLVINGSLYLNRTPITKLPNNLIVGGSVVLDKTKITSLPDNFVVGGSLYLNGTRITKLPENLTVGGSIIIKNNKITDWPDTLTAGGNILLNDNLKLDESHYHRLKEGDYVAGQYIYADKVLTHVKRRRKFNEYAFYVGKIKGKNILSDGKNYVHCSTVKEGMEDLLFKEAESRGAEQYQSLTKESVVGLAEAITMYRVITGACRQGTESFVSNQRELKKEYSINELITLTQNQFGSKQFADFFEK